MAVRTGIDWMTKTFGERSGPMPISNLLLVKRGTIFATWEWDSYLRLVGLKEVVALQMDMEIVFLDSILLGELDRRLLESSEIQSWKRPRRD